MFYVPSVPHAGVQGWTYKNWRNEVQILFHKCGIIRVQQEDDMEDPGVPCYNEPDPTFTYHEAGLQSEVPSSCMSRQPHSSTATTTQDWGHSAMGQPVVTAPTFLRPSIPALQHTHTPHIQLLLPEPDDCSLSFLLQSGDSVPPPLLSAAAAASHLPAPTDGDFLTGIPHSLYDGECSLDAFSASMGSQPMQAAPVGACQCSRIASPRWYRLKREAFKSHHNDWAV